MQCIELFIRLVIQSTRFCLQIKKTAECEKSTLIHSENYNPHELVLTFQQNHVIMVRRIWNVRDAYPTFSILSLSLLFCFSPFHPSFLPRLAFSIKIAIGIFLLFIVCLDRKMEEEEQGHQSSTKWLRE